MKQEIQLSQRDRAMLRVTEYFARSFKVIRNETVEKGKSFVVTTCMSVGYLVPFLRHSALNKGVTLKTELQSRPTANTVVPTKSYQK